MSLWRNTKLIKHHLYPGKMLPDMNFTSIVVVSGEENNNLFLLRTLTNWSRAKRKQVAQGRYSLIKIANLVGIEKTKEIDISVFLVDNAHVSGAPKSGMKLTP